MSGLSLRTLVPNLKSIALIVFEILAFNSHWPAAVHKQTDRHTSNERIIFAIHFVHLAEIIREYTKIHETNHRTEKLARGKRNTQNTQRIQNCRPAGDSIPLRTARLLMSVYNCDTQHSTEQFWQSSLLSSSQWSKLRWCLMEGEAELLLTCSYSRCVCSFVYKKLTKKSLEGEKTDELPASEWWSEILRCDDVDVQIIFYLFMCVHACVRVCGKLCCVKYCKSFMFITFSR